MEKGSFKWDNSDNKDEILKEQDLKLEGNDFLVVVGRVGCGKTSLLYSIMGETIKT